VHGDKIFGLLCYSTNMMITFGCLGGPCVRLNPEFCLLPAKKRGLSKLPSRASMSLPVAACVSRFRNNNKAGWVEERIHSSALEAGYVKFYFYRKRS
jgi:hypothetical protein